MADVFVSYARSDKARVAPLVAAIEAQGWSVWWDPEITPGQEFDRQIAAELKIAAAVLVVWTRNSVESRWVRGEAREGAERGILVPVRFDVAELPIDVRALHTTDFDGWSGDHGSPQVQEVLRALGGLIQRQRAQQPIDAVEHPVRGVSAAGLGRVAICVLPFANMSGDPEQEYFSDGISEDIITDLSKVSALSVISRNSAFVYKGKHVDITRLARELKVSHVLEGSVRKASGRVRINAQLVDGSSNDHIWAERYDRDLSDIFALQDEVTREIVTALNVEIGKGDARAAPARTANVEAYDYLLRGRAYQVQTTRESNALARRMIEKAIELDPNFAEAYAELSKVHWQDWFFRWSLDPLTFDRSLQAAQRAVVLDDGLALAHSRLALALLWSRRWDDAIAEAERALALNPASSEVLLEFAFILCLAGRCQDALGFAEQAVRLDPEHFRPHLIAGYCYFFLGKFDEAEVALKAALARNLKSPSSHWLLAATYVETGRLAEAQAEVAETLRLSPKSTLGGLRERSPFRDSAALERYLAALAKAGFPP